MGLWTRVTFKNNVKGLVGKFVQQSKYNVGIVLFSIGAGGIWILKFLRPLSITEL